MLLTPFPHPVQPSTFASQAAADGRARCRVDPVASGFAATAHCRVPLPHPSPRHPAVFLALLACLALVALALAGCGGAVDQGLREAAQYNDDKARLLARAPCGMSIAGSLRELAPQQRRLLYLFCGLEPESGSPARPAELVPSPVRPQGWRV